MHRRKRKILTCLLLALLAAAGMLWYVNASLRPVLEGLASARVESAAARAMNEAILEVLGSASTGELLTARESNEGHISLLTADAGKLNLLAADCAAAAQKRIMDLGEQGVSVALGTLSGVPLLAGLGPRLSFRFTPVGMVQSAFHSEFRSAGINQTLHRITLELTGTVRIVLPGRSCSVSIFTQAPVAENVIVGDVTNQIDLEFESIEFSRRSKD